jgi:membrane-associated phospholipid phosphatase
MSARDLLGRLGELDRTAYRRIAGTDTPGLDRWLRGLSQAANYSRLNLAAAAGLAVAGGPRGRRAAVSGTVSVAVTATIVNTLIKPLARRSRPDRHGAAVPLGRHVRMPISRSFPSGHTAAAFAFATGAGRELPAARAPLFALAALVGYSRIHTGVHYPSDVLAGALCGIALGEATSRRLRSAARPRRERSAAPQPPSVPAPGSAARSGSATP